MNRSKNRQAMIATLGLAAALSGQAATVAPDLQVVPPLDARQHWSLPLPARQCTLIHNLGYACKSSQQPPATYDSAPECKTHIGHSHTSLSELSPRGKMPWKLPPQEEVKVQLAVVGSGQAVQLRVNPASLLKELSRHHGLALEEIQVSAILLGPDEQPARLGMQYVWEQPTLVLPLGALNHDRLTLAGTLPIELLDTARSGRLVVVIRGGGVNEAAASGAQGSVHRWQSPQLRCVF